MTLPGFTAERSLRTSSGRYRVQATGYAHNPGAVQPQAVLRKGKCWCDEPDTRLVCQGGKCRTLVVCL